MAIKIDWNKVDNALMAGASGPEVAALLGIHYNTLKNKVEKEKKCLFCEYKATKRAKGDSLLRVKQFDTALTGSVPMQIWLGKNRLNQTDKKEIVSENKNINTFDLSNLTDEQLEQLASLTAIIQPDTSGEGEA
jgi:hypothetical protein